MKKLGKNILLFLFAICMPLFLGACSDNQTSSFSQKSESNIISSSTNSGLQNGGTYQGH